MLLILGLIFLLPLTANAGTELDTNIITEVGGCHMFSVRLPYAPEFYILDFDNFYFEDDFCYSATNWDLFMNCRLDRDDSGYIANLTVCNPQTHIRLSWRMPEFFKLANMPYITQFFMPNNEWKKRDEYCLQPQYSTPLIRTNLTEDVAEIKCVIYLPSCFYSETIQIYGLYENYCDGSNGRKPCGRRTIGTNLIEFTTTVPHNPHNKTQYVFCATDRDTLSIQLTWRPQETTTTEITTTTSQETPSEALTTASDETTGSETPSEAATTASDETTGSETTTEITTTTSQETSSEELTTANDGTTGSETPSEALTTASDETTGSGRAVDAHWEESLQGLLLLILHFLYIFHAERSLT
ncbi:hypothetical protein AAHC03_023066 [Spirometra sp. Aus1]